MKRIIMPLVCLGCLLITHLTAAESLAGMDRATEQHMLSLGQKGKAAKRRLIEKNMQLTETEAKGFLPIYEDYQADLDKINQKLSNAIESYAKSYNNSTLTDDQAKRLMGEALDVESAEAAMRKDYANRLLKVLPVKKVARYLQIEGKLRAIIRYSMAAEIPLVD